MAVNYGGLVAQNVTQGQASINPDGWTLMQVDAAPLNNRRQVRVQLKSNPGGAMAVAYANATISTGASGAQEKTFTAPTTGVAGLTVYPGNQIIIEPLGPNVQLYGRLVKKKGFTDNTVPCVVTEFA
jgi:hypothetical protein